MNDVSHVICECEMNYAQMYCILCSIQNLIAFILDLPMISSVLSGKIEQFVLLEVTAFAQKLATHPSAVR